MEVKCLKRQIIQNNIDKPSGWKLESDEIKNCLEDEEVKTEPWSDRVKE